MDWGGGQVLNHCTKEQTATHHNRTLILEKSIWNRFSFYRLHSLFLKYWVRYSSTPRDRGTMAREMEERASLFLCASEYFCAQSDPAIPWPGKDPDEPGIDGWVYHVLSVRVVVKVPLENLEKQQHGGISFFTQQKQKLESNHLESPFIRKSSNIQGLLKHKKATKCLSSQHVVEKYPQWKTTETKIWFLFTGKQVQNIAGAFLAWFL